MKHLLHFMLICLLGAPSLLWAQDANEVHEHEYCGTTRYMERMIQQNPEMVDNMAAIERMTQEIIESRPEGLRDELITIPVVFHVLHFGESVGTGTNISVAKIQSQIDVLNEDFRRLNEDAEDTRTIFEDIVADVEIEFCLATKDPDGLATSGITRTETSESSHWIGVDLTEGTNTAKFDETGGKDAWPTDQYLNIWTVNSLCDEFDGDVDCSILGYAQFPGGPAATDGLVLVYDATGTVSPLIPGYTKGRTATHEVGHWLNLRHVWGDGECLVDDFVDDTPRSNTSSFGCNLTKNTCTDEVGYWGDAGINPPDMVENYMDYSDDDCSNAFTNGQKQRMRALFSPGNARYSLLSSTGCEATEEVANDAGAIELLGLPSGLGNCTAVSVDLTFQNVGSDDLNLLIIKYSTDGGPQEDFLWTGDLAQFETTTITLPPIQVYGDGIFHSYEVELTSPNGLPDLNIGNNLISGDFATKSPGATELIEDFSDFPPSGFDMGGFTQASTGDGDVNSAVNLASTASTTEILLPDLDLKNWENMVLDFSYAYAETGADGPPDVLEVMISQDCGETFETIWSLSGMDLATAPQNEGNFVPTASEWAKASISLWDYLDVRNAEIKFVHTLGSGNNLYIDDINVDMAIGINDVDISTEVNLSLFPNPSIERATLSFDASELEMIDLQVINASGQVFQQERLQAHEGSNSWSINTASLPDGIYFVRFSNKMGASVKKLIVTH